MDCPTGCAGGAYTDPWRRDSVAPPGSRDASAVDGAEEPGGGSGVEATGGALGARAGVPAPEAVSATGVGAGPPLGAATTVGGGGDMADTQGSLVYLLGE